MCNTKVHLQGAIYNHCLDHAIFLQKKGINNTNHYMQGTISDLSQVK